MKTSSAAGITFLEPEDEADREAIVKRKGVDPGWEVRRERGKDIREADDDHFYGAWRGGSAKSGGGPASGTGDFYDQHIASAAGGYHGDEDGTGIPFEKRLGRCYELAGKYAMHNADATLVHGSIEGMGAPRIDHAWAETPRGVYEPASNSLWSPLVFKALFHPEVKDRYPRVDALKAMTKEGHYGPW